ncbi:type II toxin-antitoxin system RelE/ParE family toxin [Desulfoprunum benzoelyticum]|nr:type II toxin-antitoxin system RelE/ParE family toxin [Desulfoprunum benzoelyticum]
MCDSIIMRYEIETTNIFDKWLAGITDVRHRARIISRLDHIQLGNFGDHKNLGGGLFELRFFFGPGFRAYYTIKGDKVVILLCGGDKSRQQKDIEKAKIVLTELEA